MLKSLIFVSIFYLGLGTLTVYSPKSLQENFNEGIPYSVANFGHIPYGKRLIGPVVMAQPDDGCQPINITDSVIGPFVVINRGKCSFVTQVKYAQLAGARLAIIVDNIVEASQNITMGDDGLGDSVTIPSIFISEQAGQIIQKELGKIPPKQYAMFVVDFILPRFDIVNYSFFLNIPSPTGEYLVHEFQQYRKQLDKEKFLFTPHYFFFETPSWQKNQQNPNCLGNGKYCCFDPDGPGQANGKIVAQEQLRQICIFQVFQQEGWWAYMDRFHDECPQPLLYKECSEKIVKELKYDFQKVQDCYDSSFQSDSILTLEERENQLLNLELNSTATSGIIEWPGVSINNIGYRGTLDGIDVLEAICFSSFEKPKICQETFPGDYYQTESGVDNNGPSVSGIVIIVVVLLVLFFLFLVFIYRRMVKKELQKEMEEKVPSIVSNYIAFHEMNKGQKDSNL